MTVKYNQTLTLYHPEHGSKSLTRKQFKEQYGLDKQDLSDLANCRGKIRKGWSLDKETTEACKNFYFSIPEKFWNMAEKIAFEKGWTVEAVLCDAVERQLSADITEYINH